MNAPLLTLEIHLEGDVVLARQREADRGASWFCPSGPDTHCNGDFGGCPKRLAKRRWRPFGVPR